MEIIINADDFGYTKGVTDGIIEGYKNGIITSTTAMCNMPYLEYAAAIVKECPKLGIGIHLNLTCGSPLTSPKSLVNADNTFLKYKDFYSRKVDVREVYDEFIAQIERFKFVFGFMPTHIDSHQGVIDGVSLLLSNSNSVNSVHNTEEIYNISMDIAKLFGLQVRRSCKYKWISGYNGEGATSKNLISLIEENEGEEYLEFMVHPGFCDLELYRKSSYNFYRVQELDGLCSKEILDYINAHKIKMTHF